MTLESVEQTAINKRYFYRNIFTALPQFAKSGIYGAVHAYRYSKWNAAGKPVPPPHAVKQDAIKEYGKKYNVKTFIETGTFLGDMLEAVQANFDTLYSIEIVDFIYDLAKNRFKNNSKINLLLGDSSTKLPELVKQLNAPALFWLDGHFSGGDTGFGETGCPIYAEIDTIFASPHKHIILIDDARCFIGAVGYPPLAEFEQVIKTKMPNASFEVKDDIIRIVY